jgi:hypothetical protein
MLNLFSAAFNRRRDSVSCKRNARETRPRTPMHRFNNNKLALSFSEQNLGVVITSYKSKPYKVKLYKVRTLAVRTNCLVVCEKSDFSDPSTWAEVGAASAPVARRRVGDNIWEQG